MPGTPNGPRAIRAGSVRRLGHRIERLIERGDVQALDAPVNEMLRIALGQSPEITSGAMWAAFQWVAAMGGEAFDARLRRWLWARPQIIALAVKGLREAAQDSSRSRKVRREAQAVIARYGFDDPSLTADDDR